METLSLLSYNDVWGDEKLDALKKYGVTAAGTDLALLTGGFSSSQFVSDGKTLKDRANSYYTTAVCDKEKPMIDIGVYCAGTRGVATWAPADSRDLTIRPILHSPSIFSQVYKYKTKGYNGVYEVAYGEYPQYAPDDEMQKKLDVEFRNGNLVKTGKKYSFDETKFNGSKMYELAHPLALPLVKCKEYEYNGKKYIHVKANFTYFILPDQTIELSNGSEYQNGDYVWVEVSPVIWLVDEKTQTLISKRGLLSGIKFCANSKEYVSDFSKTVMKEYLDKYMTNEMLQSAKMMRNRERSEDLKLNEKSEKVNAIIDEISELALFVPNGEAILKRIDELVDNYNKDINNAFGNKKTLELEASDKNTLYLKLVSDLKEILGNFRIKSDKYKVYYEMLEIIDNCLMILNSKNKDLSGFSGEIEQFIIEIKKVAMLFVDDDKLFLDDATKMDELKNIFLEEKGNINEYLKGNNNYGDKCKTIDDFKMIIRKKLHPYLVGLDDAVRKAGTAKKVTGEYAKLVEGINDGDKKDHINRWLADMKKMTLRINEKGNDEEKEKLSKIMKGDIHDGNLDDVLKQVMEKFMKIHRVLLDMEERLQEEKELDNYIVTVNGKSNK